MAQFRNDTCSPVAAEAFGVAKWPANFLIDQQGIVRHVNVFDYQTLRSEIQNLLAE